MEVDKRELNILLKECSKEELAKELIKMKRLVCTRNVAIEELKRATLYNIYEEMERLKKRLNYDSNSQKSYELLKYIDLEIRSLKYGWEE